MRFLTKIGSRADTNPRCSRHRLRRSASGRIYNLFEAPEVEEFTGGTSTVFQNASGTPRRVRRKRTARQSEEEEEQERSLRRIKTDSQKAKGLKSFWLYELLFFRRWREHVFLFFRLLQGFIEGLLLFLRRVLAPPFFKKCSHVFIHPILYVSFFFLFWSLIVPAHEKSTPIASPPSLRGRVYPPIRVCDIVLCEGYSLAAIG